MDYILSQSLPPELVYVITNDNVVWIRTAGGENSFLVGKTNNNPYYPLRKYVDYL